MKKLLRLGIALSAVVGSQAFAASATWNGSTDANWSTAGNWSGGAAPGAITGTTNVDVATFSTNQANGTTAALVIDAGRNLKTLTFDTSAGSYTIGTTAGNALLLTSGGNITLAATVTGTGLTETINAPLVLEPVNGTGAGAYAITNASTTASNIIVVGGAISGGTTTGAVTLTLNGANVGNNAINGIISNGGAANVAVTVSAGKWALGGANTYTGTTTLSGGTLQLNNSSNGGLGSGTLNLGGGTLQSLLASQAISNNVLLTGGVIVSGSNAITFNGTLTNSGGNRNLTGSIGGNSLTLAGNVYLSELAGTGRTLTIGGGGATVISGNIANFNGGVGTAGTLFISNTSSTTLSGANTYSGGTIIGSGSGAIGAPVNVTTIGNVGGASSSLGTAGVLTIGSGAFNGQLVYNGVGETTDRVVNLGGNGGLDGTGGKAMITQSGTGLLKFTSNLTSTGVGNKTLTLQGSTAGTGEISGVIVDNTGSVSHTVNTAFSSGVTSITVNNTQNDFGVGSIISGAGIAPGTTITAITTIANVSTLTLSTPTTGAGSSGASTTVAGGLTSLTKAGTDTWTLSGANTYSGVTTINGGVLSINTITNVGGGASSLGAVTTVGNGTIALNGGTLQYTGISSGASDRVVNLAGGTTSTLDASGAATFALSGGITGNRALTLQGSGLGTESGNIAATNQNLTKTGTGTWILSGTNSYTTGITTVSQGTLEFANAASLYNSTTATAAKLITESGATTAFGVGGSGFTSTQINSLNTALITNATATTGFKSGSTIGFDTTGGNFAYNTAIANGFSGANVLGLTKLGTNTLTLGGTNTYTGATTVTAGTLLVSGSLASGSSVSVASGASLGGSGTTGVINGSTTIASGGKLGSVDGAATTLSFGATATNVDISGVASANNGGLVFELGANTAASDKFMLASGSILNIGSGQLDFSDFSFTNLGSLAAGTYTLFDSVSAINGSLASSGLSGTIDGSFLGVISLGGSNDILLTVSAVPEPSTYALLFGGLVVLGVLRSKKKRV